MSNDYFQFKQFIIHQDKCSMKVCTDACILGAWVADKIYNRQINASSILDIGAGTGLLGLMLAQKSTAKIDAVEIDENAFVQATGNFKQSLWNERLQAFQGDVKNFDSIEYDFIISNPPFYEDDLLSPQQNKNIAKHDESLNFNELLSAIKKLISSSGNFAVLLPYHRINYFEKLAGENYFFLKEKLLIKPTLQHQYFRGILLFNQTESNFSEQELVIKKEDGSYSEEFIQLLKDYYLNL
jgi:tRNA1Val (adenine37-N6)-methyltransferase